MNIKIKEINAVCIKQFYILMSLWDGFYMLTFPESRVWKTMHIVNSCSLFIVFIFHCLLLKAGLCFVKGSFEKHPKQTNLFYFQTSKKSSIKQ